MSSTPHPLQRLHDEIADLVARDDLAGVIIHLNDTYHVEARLPNIPGMARIAATVRCVTDWVEKATGEDRTLVVHSGDFLSPSFMTTRLGFAGRQMVDLLNHCGVDYVTLGNHEFDVSPDELKQRLSESSFGAICSNMIVPDGFRTAPSIVYWPQRSPFLAIAGFVGEQTIGKAKQAKFGFIEKSLNRSLAATLNQVAARPEIGTLVLLTHMGRIEDKNFQNLIDKAWPKRGMAFILGGHDHDIFWQEPERRSVLCKNLSNGRTITAIVLAKSAVAAPHRIPPRPRPWRDDPGMKELMEHWENLSIPWKSDSLPVNAEPLERIKEITLAAWNAVKPINSRSDFNDAYAARLEDAWSELSAEFVERENFLGIGGEHLFFELVENNVVSPYLFGTRATKILSLEGHRDLSNMPPDEAAEDAVKAWEAQAQQKAGTKGADVVIDFSDNPLLADGMDAEDDALRSHSTDFGNLVADAVECELGVDLAMINSGSFRLDERVGPVITRRVLQEIFLYDCPNAVAAISMAVDEVQHMLAHAQTKTGQGAFLQISRGVSLLARHVGRVRIALVRHMLVDNEDGYQGLLARLRGCETAQIINLVTDPESGGSIVDLVARGAQRIAYSAENRLQGASVSADNSTSVFAKRVDRYIEACSRSNLTADRALRLLEFDPYRAPLDANISHARLRVRLLVLILAMSRGWVWLQDHLYEALKHSDLEHRYDCAYSNFLDMAMTYFEMEPSVPLLKDEAVYPKLKDEEGSSELVDIDDPTTGETSGDQYPTSVSNRGTLVLEFADLTDVYRIACRRAFGSSGTESISILRADPSNDVLPETIRKARMKLRSALLSPVIAWGLKRAKQEFCDGMEKLDRGTPHAEPCLGHLIATFSYFDIIARNGLLADEERQG